MYTIEVTKNENAKQGLPVVVVTDINGETNQYLESTLEISGLAGIRILSCYHPYQCFAFIGSSLIQSVIVTDY